LRQKKWRFVLHQDDKICAENMAERSCLSQSTDLIVVFYHPTMIILYYNSSMIFNCVFSDVNQLSRGTGEGAGTANATGTADKFYDLSTAFSFARQFLP
jgi:hypothetical protein